MFRLRNWVRKLAHQLSLPAPRITRLRTYPPGKRVRPRLENLEPLILLSTVTWTGAVGDNNWNTGGNWSTGTTPGAGDDAVINVASPTTITHSAAVTDTVNSLTSNAAIVLSGGLLNVNTTLSDSAGLTLRGGTLGNATVLSGTTLTGTTAGGAISALTLDGNLDLETNNAATVTVANGLSLNGTINVGNAPGTTSGSLVFFLGFQTVNGTGKIFFGANAGNQIEADSDLTLGTEVSIVGGSGSIGGASDAALDNLGTIASTQGGVILIDLPGTFTNAGAVNAVGGDLTVNPGTLSNYSAGTLTGGTWGADGNVLRLVGDNITTNHATIALDGVGSHIYSNSTGSNTDALANFAVNNGNFTVEGGANVTTASSFSNSAFFAVGAGSRFTITGGGNYTETGGFTTMEGGTLTATTGSILINGGNLQGTGTLGSSVTVGSSAILELGQVQGNLAVQGDLVLDGSLFDNLVGNQVGSAGGYEQLDLSGGFFNSGSINIASVGGFGPGPTDTFQLIKFTSLAEGGSVNVAPSLNLQSFFDGNTMWLLPSSYQTATVTNTSDSGAGSLRSAITKANSASTSTFTLIAFNIPTTDSGYNSGTGVWTIAPVSALPTMTNPVLLDGTTQPGYAGKPVIDLSGTSAGASNGLVLSAGHSTIEGLAVNNFQGDGIDVNGAVGDTISGNYIGTTALGLAAAGNGGFGVFLNSSTDNTTIGGTAIEDRNVLSGNASSGVRILGTANTVQGNYIGTDATGNAALANGTGVAIVGFNNSVGGTTAAARNVISGNSGDGVDISQSTATGNVVEGNYIGTNAAGTAALANAANGVIVQNSAGANTIGGSVSGSGNLISGNAGDGILFSNAGPGSLVEGNLIGTNAAGTAPVANGSGIGFNFSPGEIVGGTTPSARNIISGNTVYGIDLNASSNVVIEGNWIGINAAGTAALGSTYGILTNASESGDVIGGTASGAGNVISGNNDGIALEGNGVTNITIQGNLIGTDPTGTTAISNVTGILDSINGITIGGTTAAARNIISGNSIYGVEVGNANPGSQVVGGSLEGNYIGTDISGTVALPNASEGVRLEFGTTNFTVGGTTAGTGNVISGNAGNGVDITDTGTTGNVVEGNDIGTNASGSDLLPGEAAWYRGNGNANDSAGANNGTVEGGVAYAPGEVGQAFSLNGTNAYIDVPSSPSLTPSSAVSAEAWINLATLPPASSPTGGWDIVNELFDGGNNPLPGQNQPGAGAYDLRVLSNGAVQFIVGTSEILPFYTTVTTTAGAVTPGQFFHVAGTYDSTTGKLTVYVNGVATTATASGTLNQDPIAVKIGADLFNGTYFQGLIDEPTIYDRALSSSEIQRIYQSGSLGESNFLGNRSNGVEIQGGASGNTIGGTSAAARNIISGNSGAGVNISGSTGNTVEGNFLGTNAAGLAALPNADSGVRIVNGSSGNTVGGTAAGAGNLISGNLARGIVILDTSSSNVVEGNKIGTDVTGTAALGNGVISPNASGIRIEGANNIVGGTAAGAGNLIAANGVAGVRITGTGATGNLVQGNLIGTDISGTAALGNLLEGVLLDSGASGNTIGGTTVTARNVISGNPSEGVKITDAGTSGNVVEGDYIGTDTTGSVALGNGGNGVVILSGAANNLIGGSSAGSRNIISGNLVNNVRVASGSGTGNKVQGNYIGLNAAGNAGLGGQNGVDLDTTVGGNFIGTDGDGVNDAAEGNVISGNTLSGIVIEANGSGNVIAGNLIGTNPAGTAALPNHNGIFITTTSAVGNRIGTNADGVSDGAERNIISGNSDVGIDDFGVGTIIAGNYVGTDIAGMSAVANGNGTTSGGVLLQGTGALVGTSAPGAVNSAKRNVISGNNGSPTLGAGVRINGSAATGNVVAGNYIGVSATGTGALANTGSGVRIDSSATNNTIGGTTTVAGNVISSNISDGVTISDGGTMGNVVEGNDIGTDFTGNDALPNSGNGVNVVNGAGGNTIGGAVAGVQNVVTQNGLFGQVYGIAVEADGDLIASDAIHAQLLRVNPITGAQTVLSSGGNFVNPDGVSVAADGSIYVAEAAFHGGSPAIIRVNPTTGAQTVVSSGGSFVHPANLAIAPNGNIFVADGYAFGGNGAIFKVDPTTGTQTLLTEGTSASVPGQMAFDAHGNLLAVYGPLTGGAGEVDRVDLTNGARTVLSSDGLLTNPFGMAIDLDGSILVENTPGPTPGTGQILRINPTTGAQTIAYSGGALGAPIELAVAPGGDLYVTNYPDPQSFANPQIVRIAANAARNIISSNAGDGVRLAGGPNNQVEGNFVGLGADGTTALFNNFEGVEIESSGNTIGGTTAAARNVISGNDFYGVRINGDTSPANGNTVEGNFIGTNAAGTTAVGNNRVGIFIQDAANNTIGGINEMGGSITAPGTGAGNVISGNGLVNVNIVGNLATGNVVEGNLIGTDFTGTVALGTTSTGVQIALAAAGNTIGGSTAGTANVISGNSDQGVRITDSGTTGNIVEGNDIGTNVTGSVALANGDGVDVLGGASGNTVGGPATGQGNTIAFNAGGGVVITGTGTTGDAIRGNAIFSNAGVGIDLGGSGVIIPNDSQGHIGPDDFADFPVIQTVTAGPTTVVGGRLQSTPSTIEYLDFYANTTPNASGHGDAQTYLGSETVTTDSTGLALWSAGGLGATSTGQYVTVTATDQNGNTSEFALNALPSVADKPPAVSITGPSSLPAANIPLALGSTLTDSQSGKTYTYAWNVTSTTDPSFALPASVVTTEPNLTFTPTESGTYLATLSVTDNLGGIGKATPLAITVGSGGQTIGINGAPASKAVNSPLTLSALATEPPNVTVTSYAWSVTRNGTAYTLPTGTITNSSNFTFTPFAAGTYVVTLTVTNSAGTTASTSVSFLAIVPSVTIVGAPANAGVGTPITVGANINAPGVSGPFTYDWSVTLNNTTVASNPNDTTGSFSFTPQQVSNNPYTISLTVLDAKQNMLASASTTFMVVSQAPVATITGAPAGVLVETPVSLGSKVTEPVGLSTTAYAWSITRNGLPYTPAVVSGTTSPGFSFTPDAGGYYTVMLLVTDSAGTVGGSSVSILVSSGTVGITGTPVSVGEGTLVSLTATPADPNVSGLLTYAWSVTSTNPNFSLPAGTPTNVPVFSFTPTEEGNYTVNLVATNAQHQVVSTTSAAFTVTNVTPTAIISGVPASATAGKPITLTGSATTPGSTDTYTFAWSALDGNTGQKTTGIGSSFTFTPSGGPELVTLTATDEAGASASASVVIVAAQAAGGIQLSQTGSFQEGGQATVNAQLATPAAGVTYGFAWTVTGQSISYSASGNGTATTSSSSTFTFTPPAPGTYLVRVTATGSDGSTAAASELVTVANVPPTVTINGIPSANIVEGTQVNLLANISDPGLPGDVLKYQWAITGPNGLTLSGPAPTFSFTPDESGTYNVSLTVTDASGAATTATASFQVNHVSPVPVIQNAPGTGISGSTLTVNMTATIPDPGGDDAFTYAWSAVDRATSQTLTTGSNASFSFSVPLADAVIVSLTVTDDDGGNATVSVPVVVAQAGTTMTLTPSSLPANTTQILALALGGAKIDGSALSTPFGAAALGGHDTLIGGAGSNVLQGDSGNNMLVGGTGPNTLFSTAGDTLVGGTGANPNLFNVLPGAGENVQAGSVANTLSFAGTSTGITLNLNQLSQNGGQATQFANYDGQAADILTLTGSFQNLVGSGGADTLFAAPNSLVYGGGGNDTLTASGVSNTTLAAGSGNVALSSVNSSNVLLFAGTGTFGGGSGNATIVAGAGSTILLQGGAGNSTLPGGISITQFGGNDTLSSSGGGNVTMIAGAGNATLLATGGSSITQFGGSGNDSLYSSGGSTIYMQGGTGNATLSSSGGSSITQFGGSGNDSLYSSGGSSIYMQGGTGNSTLSSSGGSSITQFGGSGNDSLYSSGGSTIFMQGGTGNSTLSSSGGSSITQFGGSGNDSLYSSGGSSIYMQGGSGNSTLASSGGSSITQFGGSGNDSLYSSGGSTIFMQGGTGNSTLSSSGGSSITQFGGSGNDSLYSSGGSTIFMQGGLGNSTLSATGGSSITQFGGSGNDSLYSSGGSSVLMIGGNGNSTLSSSGGSSITQFGGSGNDSLYSSGGSSIYMQGGTGNSSLVSSGGSSITQFGGSGNDSLYSSGGSSVLMVGGTGNSTLSSSGGSSITQFGGSGNDSLYSSGGSTIYMQGGTGNATLSSNGGSSITQFGGSGNDSLYSSGGSTIFMQGGTGNSTLSSSGGSSITQFGGSGNDSLYSSGGSSVLMVGGTGNSTLASSGGSSITQFGGSGNDSLYSSGGSTIFLQGGSGNSTLASSGGSSITQFGGSGNDSLYSSGGSSVLMIGGTGNSTLASSGGSSITQFGGSGNDSLYSSGGSSIYMQGGSGNSTLSSSGGSSITQFGGSGNDSLYSSGGSTIYMQGGTGNSTLASSGGSSITQFGGSGNDSLYSSGGSSVLMVGGTGNSTLASSGGSSITQFGGSGNDSLYSSGGSTVYMQGGTGNATLSSSGGSSITQFGGSGNDSLYSSGGSSVLMIGGTGNSTLASSGGSSITQFGGSGNDSLYSSSGSSIYIQGGTGNSTLASSGGSSITQFGGSGNDSLYSSGGSTIFMQGGTGNSTLSSSGGSSITQFGGSGNDSLYSSGGSSVLMVGGTGNSTLASSGGSSITQFGGSGNDSLYSSGGSSIYMQGGSGNSTLASSGGSSITQFGGSGNDSLYSSGGSTIYMQGGTGNSTLASSGGSSITQFGGSGNDSLYSSGGSSVLMVGGTGNSTLSSSGGSSITQFGGSGNDSLYSSGGSTIYMQGGTGNSTLSSSGGSSITQYGGSGNDSLTSSGVSSALVVGGSGTDTLNAGGDSNALLLAGGATNDFLSTTGGSSISLVGGSGNDTLSANGGTAVTMAGLDGNNTYEVSGTANNPLSASLNDLSTFGQPIPQTDGAAQGINTILFPGVPGGIRLDLSNASQGLAPTADQFQTVAPGLTMSLTGPFQNVIGTPGNDWIRGGASGNVLNGGGTGNDTLLGGTGPATLLAGSGNDSLVGGSGGTTYRFAGNSFGNDTVAPASSTSNDTLDFAQFGGAVNLNLTSSAAQTVNSTTGLTLTLANPLGINGVIDSAFNDSVTGNSRGDTFTVGAGNDTFNGAGGDSYVFGGTHLGSDVLNESAGTKNALNFLAFGAPVNLNLSQAVTAAPVSPGNLTLTLSNPSAFTTIVGTPYPDTVVGNNSGDTIVGAGGDDSLMGGSGSNYVQGYVEQVVYLNFTAGQPGGLIYTTSERNTIQAALTQDYNGFNYVFSQDPNQAAQLAQMTGGQFATLNIGSSSSGGGEASQLDVDHLNLGGGASVNITPFLGSGADQVSPSLTNIINLTATVAAHELGHLSGLQHQDAFGPIGSGIYSGVNPQAFFPFYTGPENATQTPNDVMASPASVGTSIQAAAGQTYLGERDLIKLAFDDTGTVLAQQNLPTLQAVKSGATGNEVVLPDPGTVYQLGTLPGLAVPNTLPAGVPGAGQTFAVTAAAVNAAIQTGQVQYYSFQATAGELISFQVFSATNTLNAHPILPALEVLDANGNLVPYAGNSAPSAAYGAGAVNQHEFESNDSTLYDVTLPNAGTYYVGVTTLPISPAGNYQLFMYSFGTAPAAVGDTLVGGSGAGNDTVLGSSGNDYFGFQPGFTGFATVFAGSGQDTLNLTTFTVPNPQTHVTVVPPGAANITFIQPTFTPTVSVSASPAPADFGQPLTLRATVTASAAGAPTATGSVDFFDITTNTDLGTVPLSGGTATLTTATLPVGTQTITATYSGDGDFLAGTGSGIASIVESIYLLNSTLGGELNVSGNASINIAGLIQVDSRSATAVQANGNASVSASAIHVVGGVQTSGNATFSVKPVTGSASVFDPEATLPAPTGGTNRGSVNLGGNQTQTISPGVYSQINVSGNARLTMNPGVYVIAGGGFTVTGNAGVTGNGVMLYNAGSNYSTTGSGGNFGGITISGNGTISLTAPTTGIYAGVLIFQERDNNRAIALSGSGVAGLGGGLIYAPQALLNISGNAQLKHAPLIVGQLQLSGNGSSTLTNGTDSTNNTAGQLLAGNLSVYVDNSNGYFTPDELARIQDVIASTDALLVPYGVNVAEVSDSSLANLTIDGNTTSPVGGMADGVLGCFTIDTGEITLIQGWNWYAGSDPTAIAAGQYSFATTVTHELGHALGLGHGSDPDSPMFATLSAGVVKGDLTVADLDLPILDTTNADALHAALPDVSPFASADAHPAASASSSPTRQLTQPVLLLNESPAIEVTASSPFLSGMGWVANWAWLALGLGGSRDPNPPASATPDTLAGDTGNGILPRGPAASLTVTGLGGNRNGIRPANDLSARDDWTTWDESNDSEGADETTTLEDRSDPAVLDQFFRKIGGNEGGADVQAE